MSVEQKPYTRIDYTHQLFELQSVKRPHALAIDSPGDGTRLSYAELNQQANQYAHYFLSLGIGPESLVGVFLQNSVARIILLLAIHKAGSGYVLLDPDHPNAYLSTILQGISCTLLVTEEHFQARLPTQQVPVINLGALNRAGQGQETTNPEHRASPHNVAYVSFTSGSTGRPKAVVIPHIASTNHVRSVAEAYRLTSEDRIPLLASPGFDMTIEDLLPPLAVGATIVLLSHESIASETLSQLVERERLTVLNLPGSLWHRWVAFHHKTKSAIPRPLRLVVVGSEAIYTSFLARWQSLRGAERVSFIAAYGLTETAVTATLYQHDHHMALPSSSTVPIGVPIPNVEAWILDEHLQVCADGEPGNLYIGGLCLAREYLNDPQLTARKFPMIHLPGRLTPTRLYDSGDRALRLPGGTLVWLGRNDAQLKWHGFRIEPFEIEQVLLQHPEVREAVIVVHQDQQESHLVAFIVPFATELPSVSSLQMFLAQKLPTSKIPSRFIPCERFPLTPSGKLNRRAVSQLLLQCELRDSYNHPQQHQTSSSRRSHE